MAALYHAHYRSLARIAALLACDEAVAEEMVQDAFVSVHRAWRHLRGEDAALGYLRRAVVSRARAHSAARPDPPGRPPGRAGAGQPAPGIAEALLMATLRGLPACQREALVLKYYADWPDPEIAAVMGVSRHALTAHIRHGMPALRSRTATAPRRQLFPPSQPRAAPDLPAMAVWSRRHRRAERGGERGGTR